MKIRIKNNEIRFRISEQENEQLGKSEIIRCELVITPSKMLFKLVLDKNLKEEFAVNNCSNTLSCAINSFIYNELQESKTQGVQLDGDTTCFIEVDAR